MRTTIAINKNIAQRVTQHADKIGNRSMTSMVEFLLGKACDYIDNHGYDAFIQIKPAIKGKK